MLCGACVRESERVNQGEGREENATREMNSNAKLLAFFSFFVFVRVLKNSTSTFFRPRPPPRPRFSSIKKVFCVCVV